jgi:hypothetical protein
MREEKPGGADEKFLVTRSNDFVFLLFHPKTEKDARKMKKIVKGEE